MGIPKSQRKQFTSRNEKVTFKIFRSADDVLNLETSSNRIVYDGSSVELEHFERGSNECGLCGSQGKTQHKDLLTSRSCTAKSIQQAALSYRVQHSCSAPSPQQIKLKHQSIVCSQQQPATRSSI